MAPIIIANATKTPNARNKEALVNRAPGLWGEL